MDKYTKPLWALLLANAALGAPCSGTQAVIYALKQGMLSLDDIEL